MSQDLLYGNPTSYFVTLLISFFITIAVYGAYPLLYALFHVKPVTSRHYKWTCYGINFILLIVVIFGIFQGTSAWPYILWTSVFISLGKKILRDKGVLIDSGASVNEDTSVSRSDIPVHQGPDINPLAQTLPKEYPRVEPSQPRTVKVSVIILNTICILLLLTSAVSLYYNGRQQQQITQLNEQISVLEGEKALFEETAEVRSRVITDLQSRLSDQNNKITDLSNENQRLTRENNFFNSHVVFIPDDNTRIYHKYSCSLRTAKSTTFWAYNTEAAQSRGYSPCSSCCAPTTSESDYVRQRMETLGLG